MLIKDREALLAFYDFPAEHRKYLRTTNVIESSFVRHRTSAFQRILRAFLRNGHRRHWLEEKPRCTIRGP